MIGISKLYCGTVEPSDALRYKRRSAKLPSHLLQFSLDKKPVVVWNMGRRCNLKCQHCYSHSENKQYDNEMSTAQGKQFISDIAAFGSPVLLFSGGEPLMRPDLFELAEHAKSCGLRVVISTNGTLITKETAKRLKAIGLSYVGVSIDGMEETNDKFRGVEGAYAKAMQGIRNCQEVGLKVGLRFTINKQNVADVPKIFDLLESENIPRICFYHLVYAGRGSTLQEEDLSFEESRKVVDLIMDRTADLHKRGLPKEVLTVDNHADGVFVYLRLLKENPDRAAKVLELLKMNGGNSTGIGIASVNWDGEVYADQFWRHHSFGNVTERKFGDIWTDISEPLMKGLKNRRPLLKGRCEKCIWQDVCNGNFRVRAEAIHGDVWAEDPACYLTDEEISVPPVEWEA